MENKLSHFDKLTTIFSSPSEVFDDIVDAEKNASNYWIPFLYTIVVGLIFTFVVFSDSAIQYQMDELSKNRIENLVTNGKMTQEQAEKAIEGNPAKTGSNMFLIFSSVGYVFTMLVTLFGSAFLFWLVGKIIFKSASTFGKYSEVIGSSMYILVASTLITMMTVLMKSSIYATPSLAFFIEEYDFTNKLHLLYSSIDLTTIWYLSVLAIGLKKLYNTTLLKTGLTVLTIWGVYVAIKTSATI
ncbi:MAG: YIP1 family protein [Bacteroidetes bacterium]|nr:YIP1 family protein [Bacteroidota bacterium]